uniref:PX domain-containing protein n=1 Tax=Clastoptera arizonana TaxID=38151 RepID=A0A1B6DLI2_9HEMI
MACFLFNKQNSKINIPKTEEIEKVTFYLINVRVNFVEWTVKHRYNDFVKLHETLVIDHCVAKDILPPKKIIGNRDPLFVETRRGALESYLTSIVNLLQQTMPRPLALFLDFQKYDILFLLQEMSLLYLNEAENLLSESKSHKFSALQMHAISERLKQPCPPPEIFDKCHDFSHVLDFCCQLTDVLVTGSWDCIGTSNIIPNKCGFELSVFKELKHLTLMSIATNVIYNLGTLRDTLISLTVNQSGLKKVGDVLLSDAVHKEYNENLLEEKKWKVVTEVDFSQNLLIEFESTIQLLPNLQRLTANENQLSHINNLSNLKNLTHLFLSANRFTTLDNLHLNISNIVFIDLSQNSISSLAGFSHLTLLEGLDLGSNIITDISEITHIKHLQKLDYIVLTGNPVATIVDYRIKVLENFDRRAAAICLDNEKPSQKELDTIAVLLALKIVKEGKVPVFSRSIQPTFPNTFQ